MFQFYFIQIDPYCLLFILILETKCDTFVAEQKTVANLKTYIGLSTNFQIVKTFVLSSKITQHKTHLTLVRFILRGTCTSSAQSTFFCALSQTLFDVNQSSDKFFRIRGRRKPKQSLRNIKEKIFLIRIESNKKTCKSHSTLHINS